MSGVHPGWLRRGDMRTTWQFNYWFGIAACCGIAAVCSLWTPAGAPLVRNGDVSVSLRPLHVLRKNDPALAVPDWQSPPVLGEPQRTGLASPRADSLPAPGLVHSAEAPKLPTSGSVQRGESVMGDEAARLPDSVRVPVAADPLVGVVRLADLDPAGHDLEAEFLALRAPARETPVTRFPEAAGPPPADPELTPLPEIRAQPRRQPQTATFPVQAPIRLTGIEPIPD